MRADAELFWQDEVEAQVVKVVLWYAVRTPASIVLMSFKSDDCGIIQSGDDPIVQAVTVGDDNELYLYNYDWIRQLPPPCAYERWSFEGNLWSHVPWRISRIDVTLEDDLIFLRVMGIPCRGFGQQLHYYQEKRGLALSPALRISVTADHVPAGYCWVVVWGKVRMYFEGGCPTC